MSISRNPLINRKRANREGWGLITCGDGHVCIQSIRASSDNLAAYEHVARRARQGSPYHQRALGIHHATEPTPEE
jgi:hypothetical protein